MEWLKFYYQGNLLNIGVDVDDNNDYYGWLCVQDLGFILNVNGDYVCKAYVDKQDNVCMLYVPTYKKQKRMIEHDSLKCFLKFKKLDADKFKDFYNWYTSVCCEEMNKTCQSIKNNKSKNNVAIVEDSNVTQDQVYEPTVYANKLGSLRVVDVNGETRFVAKDVCDGLQIGNPADATKDFLPDEKGIFLIDTLGGPQKMITVSLGGFNLLIMQSRKPEAMEWKRWVANEVMVEIYKKGSYIQTGKELTPISKTPADMNAEAGLNNSKANLMKAEQSGQRLNFDMQMEWANSLPEEESHKAKLIIGENLGIVLGNIIKEEEKRKPLVLNDNHHIDGYTSIYTLASKYNMGKNVEPIRVFMTKRGYGKQPYCNMMLASNRRYSYEEYNQEAVKYFCDNYEDKQQELFIYKEAN